MIVALAFLFGLVSTPPASTIPVTALATAAAPDLETAVVAASDEAFRDALRDALAPTGMRLIATADEPPSVVAISATARRIAERERASCVVWLISTEEGTTIVAYDRDVDRALVRNVGYSAPLTATKAAAAARTTRTMLRALRLTPDIDQPLPTVAAARVARSQLEAPVGGVAPGGRQRFAVSASVAGRAGSANGGDVGLVGTLAAFWRPDALGLGLHLSTATRASVQEGRFSGRAADDSMALTIHAPVALGPRLRVRALAGVAVHAVSLDGTLEDLPTQIRHFDPALRVGLVAGYQLTRTLDIGLTVSADALLLRQKYVVGDTPVLTVSRFQLSTGIAMTLGFL